MYNDPEREVPDLALYAEVTHVPPTLMTAGELAEVLDRPRAAVLGWYRDGEIPGIRVSGKVYFDLGRVVAALRRRGQAAAAAWPPASPERRQFG
jgi:hypothetical protein